MNEPALKSSPAATFPTQARAFQGWLLLRYLPIGVLAAGLATGYSLGWHNYLALGELAAHKAQLEAFAASYGLLAPLLFGLIYLMATALAIPAAGVLTLFGGFLFGWLTAGIVVAISATVGATLLFLAARTALGAALRRRVKGNIATISRGFEDNAFAYLLILRLTPMLPFFAVNVAPAFFKVRLSTYVATTFLGILPGTFTLAYLGEGIDSVLAGASASGQAPSINDIMTIEITLGLAALATLALLALLLKSYWSRRTISKMTSTD